MSSPRRGPDISAAQVAGSALAAVSAGVVASFLGVGGTIMGAALGSVVASIGGAVYSHSFQRAGYKLGETKVLAVVTSRRTSEVDPGPSDVPVIESEDDEHPPYAESAPAEGDPAEPATASRLPSPGGRVPRWLSWKAAVALTVVAFVIAIAAIQVFELVIGRPISGGSGGTTISHLVKPGTTKHKTPAPPKPTPSAPVVTATSTPTTTSTPTSSPTGTPTSSPTGTPSPTSTATVAPTG
jgi:hypothetical protein